MLVQEFVEKFKTHPVLFIGTGISLRYLKKSYSWENLLKKIAIDLNENNEYFLDLKEKSEDKGKFKMDKLASSLEKDFNNFLQKERNGKFKEVNDEFYREMEMGKKISRFKIYISNLLKTLEFREEKEEEIKELKKSRKNISSIITTNYDKLIENIFEFNPLIGNNILLSTMYGSLYKIHGCIDDPNSLIITEEDYKQFDEKYELIRAQLLSLFIHNPIIFLGYSLEDKNIKKILRTIFTYVDSQSEQAEKIRKNFLLVEFDENNQNNEIVEHDIDIEGFGVIRINKFKTDDFLSLYKAISNLRLPISAMDVRKVETIVQDIYTNGKIKVKITDDLDTLKNSENILAIGNIKNLTFRYTNTSEYIINYFKIIEEENIQLLEIIEEIPIAKSQYFPIYEFGKLLPTLKKLKNLKDNQEEKLKNKIKEINEATGILQSFLKKKYNSIEDIEKDRELANSNKAKVIFWKFYKKEIPLDKLKEYLINYNDKSSTNYKMLLCLYDYLLQYID